MENFLQLKMLEKYEWEKVRLLATFPAEIWLMIFDEFDDPDSLFVCSLASSFLQHLLEPKKNVYLFSQVLKILDEQKYLDYKYRPGLLRCRLACSGWKAAVNRVFENRPEHFQFSPIVKVEDITKRFRYCPLQLPFRPFNMPIDKFEDQFLPEISSPLYQHHNPFPGRYFELCEKVRRGEEFTSRVLYRYRVATEKFLEKVGHHFWHARFDIKILRHRSQDGISPIMQWYYLLVRFVRLMPNLKTLYIQSDPFMNISKEDYYRLTWRPYPFPTLNKLEFLRLNRTPAFSTILAANKHVQVLEICHQRRSLVNHYNKFLQVEWKQMRDVVNPRAFAIPANSKEELLTLPEEWTPQILKLTNCGGVTWSVLFKKLECWQDSLTELDLDLASACSEPIKKFVWGRTVKVELNLPKVTKLKITLFRHCCIDFLLGLKSLECLEIQVYRSDYYEKTVDLDEVIDFEKGLAGCFMECNIWELIPTLQQVTVGGIKYKRLNVVK